MAIAGLISHISMRSADRLAAIDSAVGLYVYAELVKEMRLRK